MCQSAKCFFTFLSQNGFLAQQTPSVNSITDLQAEDHQRRELSFHFQSFANLFSFYLKHSTQFTAAHYTVGYFFQRRQYLAFLFLFITFMFFFLSYKVSLAQLIISIASSHTRRLKSLYQQKHTTVVLVI